jgi:hypothetical protein
MSRTHLLAVLSIAGHGHLFYVRHMSDPSDADHTKLLRHDATSGHRDGNGTGGDE